VVLLSGFSTNLRALIDSLQGTIRRPRSSLRCYNRPAAGGMGPGSQAGIATRWIDHSALLLTRQLRSGAHWRQIGQATNQTWFILAGFMRILTPGFVRHYSGRLLKHSPILLPSTKGLQPTRRALEAGDRETRFNRCTFVTERIGWWPWFVQARIPVDAGDTPQKSGRNACSSRSTYFPAGNAMVLIQGRLRV